MLKNEMESYVRAGGGGLKNLSYPYMEVGGEEVKSCQNHPYVVNEWSQTPCISLLSGERFRPVLSIEPG